MTIKDVAQEAGVSISTVSRVLNHASNVSKSTERRVMEIVDRCGFTPNQSSQNLRGIKTNKIIVLAPTFSNSFYSLLIKGILNTLYGAGYQTAVGVTEYSNAIEKQFMGMLTSKQVDGMIAFYSNLPVNQMEQIAARFPYVQIGEELDSDLISTVSINNYKAAYEMTEYLIKKGHTKIAMISGNRMCDRHREAGFTDAKKDYHLDMNPSYVIYANYQYDSGFEYDSGANACSQLLALPDPPSAIVTCFDTYAVGAAKYALSKGYTLGKDLAIIGFDNTSISKAFFPSISTVSQPQYEMGCLAANLILERINNPDFSPKQIVLPHDLIIRESS